jgi:tRNA ligase
VAIYAKWCGERMVSDPTLFADYDRGVIRVREAFLAWCSGDGKAEWEDAVNGKSKIQLGPRGVAKQGKQKEVKSKEELQAEKALLPKKYMIVPVAIPGCGA